MAWPPSTHQDVQDEVGALIAHHHAAPPGAYTTPQIVSTCDSGWTQSAGTVTHDATVKRFGSASVRLTCPTGGSVDGRVLLPAAQNWTADGFTFWLRCDNWSNIIDGYLIVSTSGDFGASYQCQIQSKIQRVTNGEWMQLSFSRGDFTVNSGAPTWATVNRLRFVFYAAGGTTPSVWIDQIEHFRGSTRGVVCVGFDDGYASTFTQGKAYLDRYGIRASANIIPAQLGTAGILTEAQVAELADAGWDISAHGATDLTTMSLAAAEADVVSVKKWLDARNYKGRNIYVYPNGGHNVALRSMIRRYYQAARGTSTSGQYLSRLVPYNINARQPGAAISVATVNGWIDQAEADGHLLLLAFHDLVSPTSAPTDYTPANFQAVIDHLVTKNVDVLTLAEALERGPWGPQEPPLLPAPGGALYRLGVGDDGALITTAL